MSYLNQDAEKVLLGGIDSGMRYTEIAKRLNEQELKTPSGAPWSASYVSLYGIKYGRRRKMTKRKRREAARRSWAARKVQMGLTQTPIQTGPKMTDIITQIVSSNLTDETKTHLIKMTVRECGVV